MTAIGNTPEGLYYYNPVQASDTSLDQRIDPIQVASCKSGERVVAIHEEVSGFLLTTCRQYIKSHNVIGVGGKTASVSFTKVQDLDLAQPDIFGDQWAYIRLKRLKTPVRALLSATGIDWPSDGPVVMKDEDLLPETDVSEQALARDLLMGLSDVTESVGHILDGAEKIDAKYPQMMRNKDLKVWSDSALNNQLCWFNWSKLPVK